MRNLLLASALLFSFFHVCSQGIPKGLTASNGVFIGFYEYKPANYDAVTTTYPMIIFLHGVAERGNGTTELARVAGPGIPGYIKKGNTMTYRWNGKTETFIVLTPQLSTNYGSWPDFYIDEMIKYAKQHLRVDSNRIFLTGVSLGGGGVWHYASDLLVNARHLAGIAPVCGTCSMVNAANIANANLTVWAFHAQNDTKVSISCATGAVNSINANHPAAPPILTIYPSGDHFIWDRAYDTGHILQNPNLFEWMLAQNKSLPANKYPVAKSANATTTTAIGSVTLNANGSFDPDGNIVLYIWTRISGPTGGKVTAPRTTNGITPITGLITAGTYQFELRVVDNRANWSTTTATVTVTGGGAIQNPTAKAGSDISITSPANSVNLDGSSSSSPNGSISTFSWTKIIGPSQYTIVSPAASKTTVNNLVPGTYGFKLTVTDVAGAKDDDTVFVAVNSSSGTNKPPVANAGADNTITLPVNSTTLNGTGSSDPENALSSFSWSKISGPAQYTIANPNTALTAVSNLVQGSYSFRLLVKDVSGLQDDDTVIITVNNAVGTNQPPIARAGADDTITLPVNSATLDGKWSSDPEKTTLTFKWTKISGPTQYSIVSQSPNSAICSANNLVQGTYGFRLEVTDAGGLKDDDTMMVLVKAAITTTNEPPVARAGADITINLPVNTAPLDGKWSSDPEKAPLIFKWTKISGPTQYSIVSQSLNSAVCSANNLVQGTYSFRLEVTDIGGLKDDDTMIVKVNPVVTGAAAISKIAVEKTNIENKLSLNPNPASTSILLNLVSSYNGRIKINIYDATGRIISTRFAYKLSNQYLQTLNISNYKAGIYYVEMITENGKRLNIKFLKR